ncbi:hypothetical protein DSL72_008520 [Monilinia vaccinii-corymbosi]|uniref:Uncharacterized protein n=1 Tax=Monilinia vaccinii-corymbosi TaxID=61207 RepID=A0A8A3PKL4_9HELO|nr:hypothetical protein DSL72_008520 [Monilinia vaccinii-corymbosi]
MATGVDETMIAEPAPLAPNRTHGWVLDRILVATSFRATLPITIRAGGETKAIARLVPRRKLIPSSARLEGPHPPGPHIHSPGKVAMAVAPARLAPHRKQLTLLESCDNHILKTYTPNIQQTQQQ